MYRIGDVGTHHSIAAIVLGGVILLAPIVGAFSLVPVHVAATSGSTVAQRSPATPTNETPVVHRNPADVENTDADLSTTKGWLTDRMSERLKNSSFRLSDSEYARAKELLGEQYAFHVGRHRDIAEETDTDADNRVSAAFDTTGSSQRTFVDLVREYRETYETYQDAREAGNRERAIRLGNRLERQANELKETRTALLEGYETLDAETEYEFTESVRVIEAVSTNITETQTAVRDTLFTETRLTVESEYRRISVERPLLLRGRLTTVNGTPLAGEDVRLRAGNETSQRTVQTDGDGRFRMVYRPVRLPLSTPSVSVHFDSGNESEYLDSNRTVPVTVVQKRPTLGVSELPESLRFDQPVSGTGSVRVNETPVTGVPIAVSIGNTTLGETTSTPRGFSFTPRLPYQVPTGEHQVVIEIPLKQRAIAGRAVTRTVRIEETQSSIQLSTSRTSDGEIEITGRLLAHGSTAVPDAPVQIEVNDAFVETLRTSSDGRFETTIPAEAVPREAVLRRGSLAVVASFDGTGTNLASTTTRSTLTVQSAESGSDSGAGSTGLMQKAMRVLGSVSLTEVGGLLAGVGIIVGVLWWRYRIGGWRGTTLGGSSIRGKVKELIGGVPIGTESAEHPTEMSPSHAKTGVDQPESSNDPTVILIERARQELEASRADSAVQSAYAAVRQAFTDDLPVDSSATHWEFVRAAEADGVPEAAVERLRDMTVGYERAAFAPEHLDLKEARRMVDGATTLTTEHHRDTTHGQRPT